MEFPTALTHKHWIILAYDRRDDMGNFHEVVSMDYIALTLEEALFKAQQDYKPNGHEGGYKLTNVIEHFDGACINGHR